MATPRGLLSPLPGSLPAPVTVEQWCHRALRSIGSQHGSPANDGVPLNSLHDKQFDGWTEIELSAHEVAHGVDQGKRYYSSVLDRL